jgi:hypothetical protein
VTGRADHPETESQARQPSDRAALEKLSDAELEAELTIAAYAPGRLRWERYQHLLLERLRRRPITA